MIYSLPNNSSVAVHDIFDPLPEFMYRADAIFVDPPYNQNLLTQFSYMDGARRSVGNPIKFDEFTRRLMDCIKQIKPISTFVEMGKDFLPEYILELRKIYKYVTFYNATYSGKQSNKCYIIHATDHHATRRYALLEDLDEAKIIEWLCHHHEYQCIGDLCMGLGLVGINAYKAGRSFVGTELNEKRLAQLIQKIQKAGGTVEKHDSISSSG